MTRQDRRRDPIHLSDGVKIRAQIDSDSVKAMLATAGGGSVALLAFLPFLLDKPGMLPLAKGVMWALMILASSLITCVLHNVLRRKCSMRWEAAWRAGYDKPKNGKLFGKFGPSVKEPTICFWNWTLLYVSLALFAVAIALVGFGASDILSDLEDQPPQSVAPLR